MKKTILITTIIIILLIAGASAKTYYIPITKSTNTTTIINSSLWENTSGETRAIQTVNLTTYAIVQNPLAAVNHLGQSYIKGAKIWDGISGYYTLGSNDNFGFMYYENSLYPGKLVYMRFNLTDESIHTNNPIKVDVEAEPDETPAIELETSAGVLELGQALGNNIYVYRFGSVVPPVSTYFNWLNYNTTSELLTHWVSGPPDFFSPDATSTGMTLTPDGLMFQGNEYFSFGDEGVAIYHLTDGFMNLGRSNRRFEHIYFNGSLRDGTNSLSLQEINDGLGGESFFWNNSGEITQNDTTVFNDYIGLMGTSPSYPLHYDKDNEDNTVIYISYNNSGALVSPFYYEVNIAPDASGTVIAAVAQQKLDSESNRATGIDYIYGQYNNLGSQSPTYTQGTKWFLVDRTINSYDYPFGGATAGGNIYFGTSYSTLENAVNFGFSTTGMVYNFHDWAQYQTKASNPFGGTRAYQTWGYKASNFEGCQTYDDCYGYWSDNSNNLIDSSLWNETGGTTGLHNNPHAEMWNATENGYTITISSLNTWYNITGMNFGEYDDFTTSGNGLINTYSGRYKGDWSASFSGSGGNTLAFSVLINGQEHQPCKSYRKLGTAGDVGNMGGTCIMTLTASDNVTLAVMDINTPAQNIDIWSVNLNLVRINE